MNVMHLVSPPRRPHLRQRRLASVSSLLRRPLPRAVAAALLVAAAAALVGLPGTESGLTFALAPAAPPANLAPTRGAAPLWRLGGEVELPFESGHPAAHWSAWRVLGTVALAAALLLAAASPAHAAGDALSHSLADVQAAGQRALDLWPAAHAADDPVLDPNVKYVFGDDGKVLVDPMNNKAIPDDWWNGFIGFQSSILKEMDQQLRVRNVPQSFGWTIVLYTCLVKLLFYPLQQSQLRSTSMMQLLSPKVKDIQEKYKDDPETMQRLLGQLYSVMDVNPLGGCLPVVLQLPIYWSLYGVWRRLSAEHFAYYEEPWLWVPSLARPNPDFQFKYDWLLQFQDGAPVMGWHDYLCFLIFPVLLVGFTVISQQQAQASKPKAGSTDESQQLILQVLPWVSVYFIGTLSLELPQAVSLYYAVNTGLSLAQTAFVKFTLRNEIPGYAEFEKTGKFPEGAFEDMVKASTPAPKTLHEAALRGDDKSLAALLESGTADGTALDINAWDEKEIAPLGYAVATGQLATVQLLIARGANLQIVDGQQNTLLHYAAGYGHQVVLQELLEQDVWKDGSWMEQRNKKGQSVVDAARVNRKGPVLDFLREKYGLEPEVPLLSEPAAATAEAGAAPSASAAAARAAMLAAAESGAADAKVAEVAAAAPDLGAAVSPPSAEMPAQETASAMRAAVAKLKENPEALEQARKMMGKLPPQLLSMLSGNKMSAEQAQKAMDAMQNMSTEDILEKAGVAADRLSGAPGPGAAASAEKAAGAPQPTARIVD